MLIEALAHMMDGEVALLGSGWRPAISEIVRSAQEEVTICAPFAKASEVEWLLNQRRREVHLSFVTNVRLDSVLGGSLDLTALALVAAEDRAAVVNVPRLHAKVYVSDEERALVTSANLTPSALDRNHEYGVLLSGNALVSEVRRDIDSLIRIGNALGTADIADLDRVSAEVDTEQRRREQSVSRNVERAFHDVLRRAHHRFVSAQVGPRSANQLFGEAIRYVLSTGPMTTAQIGVRVQRLLPDLCDDSEELIINGERFGKAWKHRLRNAQQHLKRARVIAYEAHARVWRLVD